MSINDQCLCYFNTPCFLEAVQASLSIPEVHHKMSKNSILLDVSQP